MISPVANKKRRITSQSQPTKIQKCELGSDTVDSPISQPLKSFSQPAGYLDDMVISLSLKLCSSVKCLVTNQNLFSTGDQYSIYTNVSTITG